MTVATLPPSPYERQAMLVLGSQSVMLDDVDGGWQCVSLDLGYPDVRAVTDPIPGMHGVIDRTQFFGGRVITASLTSWDGGRVPLDQITAQFGPFLDVGARPELHYTTKGNPTERVLTLRASAWSAPMLQPNYGASGLGNEFQLSFVAADPIPRSAATSLATAWAGSSTLTGRLYSWKPPRLYVSLGGSPANGTLISHGSLMFRPLLRIYGPITAPVVKFVTQNSAQTFIVAALNTSRIDAGNYVEIDTGMKTAFLNGQHTQPWLSKLDWTQMNWPVLPVSPDQTVMSLTGNNTTGASQVQATWQDRFFE
jgi:hypothetical protein